MIMVTSPGSENNTIKWSTSALNISQNTNYDNSYIMLGIQYDTQMYVLKISWNVLRLIIKTSKQELQSQTLQKLKTK